MDTQKTNVFITIDYELFMGESTGSVINCIIRPTDRLIEILNMYDIKSTIFVDAAYLLKVSELKHNYKSLENDYEHITSHIRYLSKNGHDIQLHIHPQWLHSDYSEKGWKVNPKLYKLSDLEKSEAETLFAKSKLLLESIINKPVIAFRAGGYSLQTYVGYTKLFSENGIIIDSSVLLEAFADTEFQKYDFRLCPSFERYKFKNNIMIEDNSGPFIEIPISRHKVSLGYYIYKRLTLNKKYDRKSFGDGTGTANYYLKKVSLFHRLFYLFTNSFRTACIDNYSSRYLNYLYSKHKGTNSKDFIIIGHPKNLSELSLYHLEQFIRQHKKNSRYLTVASIVEFNLI